MKITAETLEFFKETETTPFNITQLLVGLELGETDEKLLKYINFLVHKIPTSAAYFLNVLRPVDFAEALDTKAIIGNFDLNEITIKKMEVEVMEQLDFTNRIYVEFDVREGNPMEELLKEAEGLKTDMVALGFNTDHAHHGILPRNFARTFKGNLLVVPDQARPKLNRIIVPIDFSKNSIKALQTAAALQKTMEDELEIVCVFVYEVPSFIFYKISKTYDTVKTIIKEDRTAALQDFVENYFIGNKEKLQIKLIEKLRPGIGKYIMDYAENNEADMIIMGAKGHSKAELIMLGSVTEKVLSLTKKIPVMVIK